MSGDTRTVWDVSTIWREHEYRTDTGHRTHRDVTVGRRYRFRQRHEAERFVANLRLNSNWLPEGAYDGAVSDPTPITVRGTE